MKQTFTTTTCTSSGSELTEEKLQEVINAMATKVSIYDDTSKVRWVWDTSLSEDEKETKMAFKVGDLVRVAHDAALYGTIDNDVKPGETGTIVDFIEDYQYPYEVKNSEGDSEWFNEKQLVKKGLIMSVISKARELTLSKEERLRRKHGVVNDCGQRTNDGTELLLDLLFTAHLPEIDKKLNEIEAEEKAAKKA